jgi:Ubiquitin-like modifier-activating enzyme ATG7 N-terminus
MTGGGKGPSITGQEGASESDVPHIAESETGGRCQSSVVRESDNSCRERTGIVCMYRGMASADLWASERASSNGLPPVFALTRVCSAHVSTAELSIKDQSPSSVGTVATTDRTESVTSRSSSSSGSDWSVTALSTAWHERYSADTYIVCTDTSSSPTALGWSVRNVLALLAVHIPQGGEDRGPSPPESQVQGPPEGPLPPISPASAGSIEFPCIPHGAHSGVYMSNVIVLRGSTARKMYSCADREKVEAFLQGLSDEQLGEREERGMEGERDLVGEKERDRQINADTHCR